jgi:hypothetical protein
VVLVLASLALDAQGRRRPSFGVKQVAPYTGNLTFTRLFFGGGGLSGFGFGGDAWSHDYPAADRHIGAIIDYISHIRVNMQETNILSLDDPELFENPILRPDARQAAIRSDEGLAREDRRGLCRRGPRRRRG